MSSNPELLDTARLSNKGYSFTLPKRVRKHLNIEDATKPLGFFEEETGEISVGHQGKNILGSAEFSPTFHVTLVKRARKILKVEKGNVLFFYVKNEKVFMTAKPISME